MAKGLVVAQSVLLGLAILATVGANIYIANDPGASEKFTEFYILGLGSKAAEYPREMVVGDKASVIVGMVNHEAGEMGYRVEVVVDGVKDSDVAPPTLADKAKWEQEVSFRPSKAGNNQKVEFLLYKGTETTPSQDLHLWIDVKE